jgi:beta-phosphoglucomutase family hydrolase
MNKTSKAVIYDMDGLMIDSEPIHAESWKILLKKYNHDFDDIPKEQISKYLGMRVFEVSKGLVEILKLKVDHNQLFFQKEEIFLGLIQEKCESMPGLTESLELFKKNNFKIALASSATKKYINIILDKLKIGKFFDVIISGDNVEHEKPHPETYLTACKKLKLNPDNCIVFEDAEKGIQSAKSAGCKCVAIVGQNHFNQNHSKADLVLDSLEEMNIKLIQHFDSRYNFHF